MRLRCMSCEEFIDAGTGWLRDPNGVTCCWPCYEAGKMPPFPHDMYADEEPEPAPKPKRQSQRAAPVKPRKRAVDSLTDSIVEGW